MKYSISTAATTLPVSIAEVKKHLRIESYGDHDDMIESYIEAATDTIEKRANIMIGSQTWKLFLSSEEVTENIFFYKSPITSISSIKYYDSDNALQTLSSSLYTTVLDIRPAQIIISELPSVYDRTDAMEITFVGGYTTTPRDIKLAIKQRCYKIYNSPDDTVEQKMTLMEKVIRDYRSYEK
jgi:uncharacterized phiE125 gp8 family phage protein